ncbi:sodium/glutamate symporter [Gilvimarinus polysaccharolyticus]|uniref:sodium/glutamate symporter n=1 Tax=Gilvimarinus polysaccharolyticus TaxID=863921 RepID=UPI000673252C|nr:sodium/glutamate symporter [Gilvimarinus polysaccharolyticus]
MITLSLPPIPTLILCIFVLFVGIYVNQRLKLLGNSNIPPSVTGGILFSVLTAALYFIGGVQLLFDMQVRDFLLLVFFSTIGLAAKLSILSSGGRALVKLVAVAAVFLILQDIIGVAIAVFYGVHPGYGLMAGSISLAGGHGTAIAWGAEAEAAGLYEAGTIGITFATFGLVAGGIIGAPIAKWLIEKNQLSPNLIEATEPHDIETATVDVEQDPWDLSAILTVIVLLALCVQLGELANQLLFKRNILLPGFLTAMFAGIVLTNAADRLKLPVSHSAIAKFGEVSLSLFLGISLMSLQLWSLASNFTPIIIALLLQTLTMTLFAIYIVFKVMGRDYDAAVISAGFAGLGLGATPVAIANMDSTTGRYGPSPKAFLIVPLVGAFFIDILNASTIKLCLSLMGNW